ncbi:cyclopropane-fatty-acyl-phospholipid synthase family protein [Actinocorallia sp. API 0066]|uniref:SAM-dependent methyltransferase n=1 Tax=Actinocorallia sp. API 0066 TaxID=2896846 RepID=UPI001E37AFC8|nr:cyclopropane-fatty-acyl-phospholipid synthase family protein [Actinocorallia sp. API 0066]MCD0448231.1 cyclopropane-fatty-acyl-phospholipid synthase family protein [Actinocorallia sp. API 0066]
MSGPTRDPGYRGASAVAIEHHYDLGNDFFALWLDDSLTYTCALWEPGDDLESAQRRKLEYLAEGAGATGAARVLDVGCGWGSMLRHLVEREGVAHATGLTLSRAQVADMAAWTDARYDVRVENWADHRPARPYDAVISIGAFEHFARHGMNRAERLAAYRAFFSACRDWLPPGGRLALQTNIVGNAGPLPRRELREMLFIIERIFPESVIPPLSEVVEAAEKLFDVVTVRNDPGHYALTTQAWHDRLAARRAEAEALVGERAVADYLHYLSASARHFRGRYLGLARLVLERV